MTIVTNKFLKTKSSELGDIAVICQRIRSLKRSRYGYLKTFTGNF